MSTHPTKSLDRNSRLSVAQAKNRAEQNTLNVELSHLEKEKQTALRMLQNDKQCFKLKYTKSNIYTVSTNDEILSKYFTPSVDVSRELFASTIIGDSSSTKSSNVDFEEIHNMLFTDDEIDIEKILCLHLLSAHRTESLTPPKRKLAFMCKIHSPLERLLERSKRKNIHLEQKMANMLPIYTVEMLEFGPRNEQIGDLINDGRLATRILLNEKIRELINTVLNALRQSNPEKSFEIFQIANDTSCLKKLFTKKKILGFLDILAKSPLINRCESFILTAPFRVKSIQLELRTISGTLEALVKQIRKNVLQLPARSEVNVILRENCEKPIKLCNRMSKKGAYSESDEGNFLGEIAKKIEDSYTEKQTRRTSDPDKKLTGRHTDTDFIKKNIDGAANAKKFEYIQDEDDYFYPRAKRSSQSSTKSRRRSSEQKANVIDRPNIQPIQIPPAVNDIMAEKFNTETIIINKKEVNEAENVEQMSEIKDSAIKRHTSKDSKTSKRSSNSSSANNNNVKIHLKQTTCPACMIKYKIPLPTPKTPRVKPQSIIPLGPGENPHLKTNSQLRISMLINKEMFKLQSYERRFLSEGNSRKNSLKRKNLESFSSSYLNLSPLELAKIEQEIKEKETQKKLEKFLKK